MCVYIHMYVYIYMYVDINMCVDICVYICKYIYMYIVESTLVALPIHFQSHQTKPTGATLNG